MNRFIFAGYLNWANDILAGVVAHPDAASVRAYVIEADEAAVAGQRAFNRWEYATAAAQARYAYEQIALAAQALGIESELTVPLRATTPTERVKQFEPIR